MDLLTKNTRGSLNYHLISVTFLVKKKLQELERQVNGK